MIRPTRHMLCLFATILSASCAEPFPTPDSFEQDCARLAAQKGNDSERLHELFKVDWEHRMNESPETATYVGYPGQNDRWTDQSLEAIARRKSELPPRLKVIETIDRAALSAADRLSYDLFKKGVVDGIEGERFKGEYMAITQMSGVQQEVPQVLEMAPHVKIKDYRDIIARLNGVPALIEQNILLLEKGIETGITPPKITLRDVPQQIKSQTESDPEKNDMLKPFREFPPDIADQDRKQLRGDAERALKQNVIPA